MTGPRRTQPFTGKRILFLSALAFSCLVARGSWSTMFERAALQEDEKVVWFSSVGHLSEDRSSWTLDIRGWVFEPEDGDLVRDLTVVALRESLGIDGTRRREHFDRRVRWFLVDSQRGKELTVEFGLRRFELPATGANGHIEDQIQFPADIAGKGPTLSFETVVPDGDERRFRGEVFLVPPSGLSVISDIDDTIKISEVTDKKRLMQRTFLEPFGPVPGMAELYRRWAQDHEAMFHFVSGSPWQLYSELAEFTKSAGFPPASFALRMVRFKDISVLELVGDPIEFKVSKIAPLVERFPGRRFVLVGDSGEKDPEVYGEIARRFPQQILRIFIRDVTGEDRKAARFVAAMESVPAEKWAVFRDPSELRLPR